MVSISPAAGASKGNLARTSGAAALALLAGLVSSGLARAVPSPVLLVLLVLAAAAVLVSVLDPEVGLGIFVFLTYTRLSDVAVQFHGAPSLLQPFAVLLVVSGYLRGRSRSLSTPALWLCTPLLLAWAAVQALSLFFAPDPGATGASLAGFAKNALVVLLVATLLKTRRALDMVESALLAAGLLLSLISVYQYFTDSLSSDFGGLGQASLLNITAAREGYRVGGPIGDANYYAQILLVLVPLGLHQLLRGRSMGRRALAGSTTGLMLLTVVFTFSRGAAIAAAVVAVLVVLHARHRLLLLTALGVVLLLLVPHLPEGYVSRVSSLGQLSSSGRATDPSLQDRTRTLDAGLRMLADHPVLGVGSGNYSVVEPNYAGRAFLTTPRLGTPAHDIFLEVAAETGGLGLAVYSAVVVVVLRSLRRTRRRARAQGDVPLAELMWALQVSVLAYLAASVFIHAAYPRYMWLLFGICLAVVNLQVPPLAPASNPGLVAPSASRTTRR
ncbi:MAG: hypothetical protein JWM02_1830 [Frankiales bacterium]|nr:hypothetical protein [Frankiales bacterium]